MKVVIVLMVFVAVIVLMTVVVLVVTMVVEAAEGTYQISHKYS
jgi:hypothetical protein